jgi:hypothetical protein
VPACLLAAHPLPGSAATGWRPTGASEDARPASGTARAKSSTTLDANRAVATNDHCFEVSSTDLRDGRIAAAMKSASFFFLNISVIATLRIVVLARSRSAWKSSGVVCSRACLNASSGGGCFAAASSASIFAMGARRSFSSRPR